MEGPFVMWGRCVPPTSHRSQRVAASDKKTLASTAVHAPAWMRPTLVSIANAASGDIDG